MTMHRCLPTAAINPFLQAALMMVVAVSFAQTAQSQAPQLDAKNATTPVLIDDVRKSDSRIATSETQVDPDIMKWEDDVQKLEKLDATEPAVPDGILFVGSSSIRRWDNIASDMAPYRTIRRGYGGAKYSDVAYYARRLITPHDYRALILFVGNDVAGKPTDHSPAQVETWILQILNIARTHRPDSPVLIIEVTPTPSRFDAWPEIRELNARLREIALTQPNTYFVPTAELYLDRERKPREELFVEDRLHLNEEGYSLWSGLIRRRLDEVFRQLAKRP